MFTFVPSWGIQRHIIPSSRDLTDGVEGGRLPNWTLHLQNSYSYILNAFFELGIIMKPIYIYPLFDNEPYIKLIELAFFIMGFPASSVESEGRVTK